MSILKKGLKIGIISTVVNVVVTFIIMTLFGWSIEYINQPLGEIMFTYPKLVMASLVAPIIGMFLYNKFFSNKNRVWIYFTVIFTIIYTLLTTVMTQFGALSLITAINHFVVLAFVLIYTKK